MKNNHKLFSILVSIMILSSLANCSLQKVEQTDSLSGSLDFSTYLGGDGGDSVLSMERDSEGNIYIGGKTSSSNFPMKNAYQDQFHTYGVDAFLAKVTSDGQLLWSTYLGGDNEFNHSPEMNRMYGGNMGELLMEAVNSIQVTNDAIYAGGYTNAESFPEFQYSSPHDYWFLNSFIAEFTLDGEFVRILELPYIEDDGYLVLQNFKWINDDTIIVGGLQYVWPEDDEGQKRGDKNMFISSLHVGVDNQVTLNWKQVVARPYGASSLQGSLPLQTKRIAPLKIDCFQDKIYTACVSSCENKPCSSDYEEREICNYICCYSMDGELIWEKCIDAKEIGTTFKKIPSWIGLHALSISEQGIFIGGKVASNWASVEQKESKPRESWDNDFDIQCYVTHLNLTGKMLQSKVFGGNGDDAVFDIAINDDGMVFVTGSTESTDFPLLNPLQNQKIEEETAFVSIFSTTLDLLFSTYWGGKEYDMSEIPEGHSFYEDYQNPWSEGFCIQADCNSFILSGYTTNNTIPLKNAYQTINPTDICPFGSVFLTQFLVDWTVPKK